MISAESGQGRTQLIRRQRQEEGDLLRLSVALGDCTEHTDTCDMTYTPPQSPSDHADTSPDLPVPRSLARAGLDPQPRHAGLQPTERLQMFSCCLELPHCGDVSSLSSRLCAGQCRWTWHSLTQERCRSLHLDTIATYRNWG